MTRNYSCEESLLAKKVTESFFMCGKSPKEQSFDNITNKNSLMHKDTKSVYNLLSPNTSTLKGNI